MDYNDYQLEELENNAVNGSNTAKRVAAVGALVGTGALGAYAVTKIIGEKTDDDEELTKEDIEDAVDTGAENTEAAEQQAAQTTQAAAQPAARPAAQPVPPHHHVEHEPEVSVDNEYHIYDEKGNLSCTIETGSVDGHNFALVDEDLDGYADVMYVDRNGNGQYGADERYDLNQEGVTMRMTGVATEHHDYVATEEGLADVGNIHDNGLFKSTHIVDEHGHIEGEVQEGFIDGKKFMAIDSDNDGRVNILAYDRDGNNRFTEDEITTPQLHGENIAMMDSREAVIHTDKVFDNDGDLVGEYTGLHGSGYSVAEQTAIDDIHNDFDGDYNNHANTNLYTADAGIVAADADVDTGYQVENVEYEHAQGDVPEAEEYHVEAVNEYDAEGDVVEANYTADVDYAVESDAQVESYDAPANDYAEASYEAPAEEPAYEEPMSYEAPAEPQDDFAAPQEDYSADMV